jgi:hypothetical protein
MAIGHLMFILFLTGALSQIISSGLKSVVAIVATPAEVATTGALVNVMGSIGSAIGSSLLAPILIKLSGIDVVLYVTGFLHTQNMAGDPASYSRSTELK